MAQKTQDEGHEAIRNGDRYLIHVDEGDWLVWSEVDGRGIPHPFIGVCNESTGECGMVDEGTKIPEGKGEMEIPRFNPDLDEVEPLKAPVETVAKGVKDHRQELTKARVKEAL